MDVWCGEISYDRNKANEVNSGSIHYRNDSYCLYTSGEGKKKIKIWPLWCNTATLVDQSERFSFFYCFLIGFIEDQYIAIDEPLIKSIAN